jgi:hypothetical protein
MSTNAKIEPVNGPVTEEVESSDKIRDGSGEGELPTPADVICGTGKT